MSMKEWLSREKVQKNLRRIIKISNFAVFIGLLYASMVLYKIGQWLLGSIVLFALGFYILFNKVEALMQTEG